MFKKTEMRFRTLMNEIITIRHNMIDKEDFIMNKINDTEKYVEELTKKSQQIEKRINTISDYIQGSYTQQINENFRKIDKAFDLLLTNVKKELNNSKTSKKKGK